MKLLALMAAGVLLAAAQPAHAQAAQQGTAKPAVSFSKKTAHVAPAAAVQQPQTPADTTRKAHKSTKSKTSKAATSKTTRTRHARSTANARSRAKTDTTKKKP